jgi:hypothetical protein
MALHFFRVDLLSIFMCCFCPGYLAVMLLRLAGILK